MNMALLAGSGTAGRWRCAHYLLTADSVVRPIFNNFYLIFGLFLIDSTHSIDFENGLTGIDKKKKLPKFITYLKSFIAYWKTTKITKNYNPCTTPYLNKKLNLIQLII